MKRDHIIHNKSVSADSVIVRSELRLVSCCNFNRLRADPSISGVSAAEEQNIRYIGDMLYGGLMEKFFLTRSMVLSQQANYADLQSIEKAFHDLCEALYRARKME